MKFDEAIEVVRQRVNIVDIIQQYVRLTRSGSNYMGLCPFHNEKTPSFSVSESKQIFKCFGCQKGGNVYSFLMLQEGMTFPEAVKFLAKKVNVTIEDDYSFNNEDRQKKELIYKLYKDVTNAYYSILYKEEGKTGLQYLTNRHLTKETIRKFGLGYAPNSYGAVYKLMKQKGYDDKTLMESKLFVFKDDKVYDFFYDRVMFPLVDTNHNVVSFQGRILTSDKEQKYINTAESLIYKKSRHLYAYNFAKLTKKDYLILCEGNMDVISLHQAGIDNAVASWGTAFTMDQANLIKRKVRKVYLCQDTDSAGIKAISAASKICEDVGLETYVIDLGGTGIKDPDEYINKYGAESFEKILLSPKSTFMFLISTLDKKYDKTNSYDYQNYIKDIVERLGKCEDELVRDKLINDVSIQEHLDLDSLSKSVRKYLQNNKTFNNSVEVSTNIANKENVEKNDVINSESFEIEKLFIDNLLNNLDKVTLVEQVIKDEDINDLTCRQLYDLIKKGYDMAKIDDYKNTLDSDMIKKIDSIIYCSKLSDATSESSDIVVLNELIRKILINKLERSKPTTFDEIMNVNNKIKEINSKVYIS